jgi:branched-chain amino acid transport system substrate-binding protein
MRKRHPWLRRQPLFLVVSLGLCLAACSGSSGGGGSHGTLAVDVFEPFSGPDAAFGPLITAGCLPAVAIINNDGGVLGHKVTCKPTDTRGDPADAVPAARQMLATTSNLVGIIGPSSDESTATIPIFEQAGVPFFTNGGQPIFDTATNPYFFRIYPPDDSAGYAMGVWGHIRGYTRAAAVFGNDPSEQGTVPTLLKAFARLGGQMVINEAIVPDQSSYRSEIERLLQKHPQVIFTEVDPQTAATFLSELRQLNGSLLPIIGADPTLLPTWFKPVAAAIGAMNVIKYHTAEQPATPPSTGAGWLAYKTAILAPATKVPSPGQYVNNYTPEVEYDSVNIIALAMLAAKSTDPKKFDPYIVRITVPSAGAVQVATFAAGKAALASGKSIQYVGVTGPFLFNKFHNAPVRFEIDHFDQSGNLVTIAHISAAQLAAAIG